MTKDLFKWTPMTDDLRAARKPTKTRHNKSQSRRNIEAWMNNADNNQSETLPLTNVEEDDVDVWLNKVRKAADVAKSDVVLGCEAEVASSYACEDVHDCDVSSMFARIISDYIPDYEKSSERPPEEKVSMTPLDDRYDTVTEAKGILNSWLQKKAEINEEQLLFDEPQVPCQQPLSSKHYSSRATSLLAQNVANEEDELARALNHLRSVPVEQTVIRRMKGKRKVKNPVLSMAARQDQAKERRQKMEEERLAKMKEAVQRKAARTEAERALQEERARKAHEEKQEEDKIQAEMVALRKRLREEQQQKLHIYEREVEEQTESHKAELAAEYRQVVFQNAEEEVKRKRLLATRHILLKQLQEAERKDMKERYSSLQQTFTKWRERTLDRRVLYNKAVALYEWKTQVRAWRLWRTFCQSVQDKREEKIKEALFRENKKKRVAEIHFQKSHLRYYFKYWDCWTRARVQDKEDKMEEMRRRRLMEQCLAAATEMSHKAAASENLTIPTPEPSYHSSKYQKKRKLGIKFEARRNLESSSAAGARHDGHVGEDAVQRPVTEIVAEIGDVLGEMGGGEVKQKTGTEVKGETIRTPTGASSAAAGPINPWDTPIGLVPVYKSVGMESSLPKGTKTPAALKGMEERARQRALRRQEIEDRKEERRQQAEQARIEEAKRKAEAEERQRQAEKEKRLKEIADARGREQARIQEIQLLKEKTLKAINHYHNKLKVNLVLNPLKRLCEKVKSDSDIASLHRNNTCLARHWQTWKLSLEIEQLEKEETATQFYRSLLLRHALRCMTRALSLQDSYTRIAERHYKRVLRVRVLRAWHQGARQSATRRGEVEVQAIELNKRITLRNHLIFWRRLIPLLVREREAGVRKAKMRSMIAELLPDYTPPDAT